MRISGTEPSSVILKRIKWPLEIVFELRYSLKHSVSQTHLVYYKNTLNRHFR